MVTEDLSSYLDSEEARYKVGAIIRSGVLLGKGHREIADDVLRHIGKQADR